MGFVFGISSNKSSFFTELVNGQGSEAIGPTSKKKKKGLAMFDVWWQRSFWNPRVPGDLAALFWTPQFQNMQKCGSTESGCQCEQDSKVIRSCITIKAPTEWLCNLKVSNGNTDFVLWGKNHCLSDVHGRRWREKGGVEEMEGAYS